jgi:hypothetical protein
LETEIKTLWENISRSWLTPTTIGGLIIYIFHEFRADYKALKKAVAEKISKEECQVCKAAEKEARIRERESARDERERRHGD